MGSWRRGRGGLIGSPAPGGSGRGPAQLGEQLRAPPHPSPRVPGQGMSCSRRSLPGARGQGGPGGRLTLLSSSPTSSPPRCEPEPPPLPPPPPPLPPLTHAAPGLAGRWVWDGVRGWGEPCGERASRRPLAAVPCAGERPRRPPARILLRRPPTRAKQWLPGKWPADLWWGESRFPPSSLSGVEDSCPPSLRSESTPSVHSLFCWSR